ncbi:hypothetical protein ACJQWK_06048 [Exserohilum turcicum]|uniref:Uncharacterized protein n=1 Tax=Exserohilum turcicum (strain 28A) TaxID=671987 RepID=R0KIR0_EXST2|nr:uncharacterized protein SETTUDRAFT_27128 [Exserohilum turcica Et28A]EOA89074.1 hypothetical protein SETTUDRAFT_27128 [Exserohilum turcica Et28A]
MAYQQLPKLQQNVQVEPLDERYSPPPLAHHSMEDVRSFEYEQPSPQSSEPQSIRHKAHWSSSTHTTAVTSETSSQQSSRKPSRARTWVFEMMAIAVALGAVGSIIGVVFRYNGQALPD